MAEDNVSLGGFDLISDLLTPGGNKGGEPSVDTAFAYVDPDETEKFVEEQQKKKDDENEEETEETSTESIENEEENEPEGENEEETQEPNETETIGGSEEEVELEKDMTSFLKSKFEEDHGITFSGEEISSVDDIVKELNSIVEEGSKPQYATDEVAEYDKFVREGGSLHDFYKAVYEGKIDAETVDISVESNQKAVLKELLQAKGYKNENIDTRIERYDTAGVLEDEAIEALELLKEYNNDKRDKLLDNQKKSNDLAVKQQRDFIQDVETTIDEMSDIRGIPLTKQEKDSLKNYLFKPGKDGRTDYQVEYMNTTRNLVESAYFTKNGKSLIKKAQDKAASDAYKKVQKTFASRKGKRQQGSSDQSASGALRSLGDVSNLLLRKN